MSGLIVTFAPERTVSNDFLPTLGERVRAGGGALRLVELRCAAAEIERRLGEPSRQRFGKLRDVALYRELEKDGAFAGPVMPPAELVIETDAIEPAEAARAHCPSPIMTAELPLPSLVPQVAIGTLRN